MKTALLTLLYGLLQHRVALDEQGASHGVARLGGAHQSRDRQAYRQRLGEEKPDWLWSTGFEWAGRHTSATLTGVKRWPAVDRDVRRRLLDELRRRQNAAAKDLTVAQRLARLDALRAPVYAVPGAAAHLAAGTSDEPIELWLRMKARFREAR